ncbi:MAG: MarR family transcriptional regulator, partial [Erysipelotrichaceae bacterium]
LYALNDDEKHSQKDICDGWSIPRTTINTIIKDLEKQQMVEMIPIFGKRRKKYKNS